MTPTVRIIFGLVLSLIGFSMVFKTMWYMSMLGILPWAETKLGPGGTRLFYKLTGVFFTLMGFIIMTNLTDEIFGGFFRALFG